MLSPCEASQGTGATFSQDFVGKFAPGFGGLSMLCKSGPPVGDFFKVDTCFRQFIYFFTGGLANQGLEFQGFVSCCVRTY